MVFACYAVNYLFNLYFCSAADAYAFVGILAGVEWCKCLVFCYFVAEVALKVYFHMVAGINWTLRNSGKKDAN